MEDTEITEDDVLEVLDSEWYTFHKPVTATRVIDSLITQPAYSLDSAEAYMEAYKRYRSRASRIVRILKKLARNGKIVRVPGFYYSKYVPIGVDAESFSELAERGLEVKGNRVLGRFKELETKPIEGWFRSPTGDLATDLAIASGDSEVVLEAFSELPEDIRRGLAHSARTSNKAKLDREQEEW